MTDVQNLEERFQSKIDDEQKIEPKDSHDAHVSRVLAVSIIVVAAILAGWLGLKPGPDAIIRADQWNVPSSDTGSRP